MNLPKLTDAVVLVLHCPNRKPNALPCGQFDNSDPSQLSCFRSVL